MLFLDEFEVENGADEVIRGVNDADECFCYDAFVYFVVEIQGLFFSCILGFKKLLGYNIYQSIVLL